MNPDFFLFCLFFFATSAINHLNPAPFTASYPGQIQQQQLMCNNSTTSAAQQETLHHHQALPTQTVYEKKNTFH